MIMGIFHPLVRIKVFLLLILWMAPFVYGDTVIEDEKSTFTAQFASQQTIDGANTIAVTFSSPLDSTQDLNRFFAIFNPDGVPGEGGWVLSDDPQVAYFANIEADTKYAVEVHKGLKSADGAVLPQKARFEVKTRPVAAMIHFGSKGFLLASTLSRGLPVNSVNIDQADIDFFRVKPTAVTAFINEFGRRNHVEYYMSKALNRLADLVYSGRWDLTINRDLRTEVNIPITHIDALKVPGVYVAVLKGAGIYNYDYSSTWFTISDLGLHVRKYQNALQVQVQSLDSAQPVLGVTIQAVNQSGGRIAQVASDAAGLARLRGDLKDLQYIIARKGDDITLLPMDLPAMDLSEFRAVTETLRPVDLFVYGPRDLYRPGETVVIDALLRKHDGLMTAGLPLQAKIFRPDGRMIHEATLKSRNLNAYHHTYLLPADALTGSWRIEFTHAGQPLKPYRFTVADFLPERMKLALENPEGQNEKITQKDPLSIVIAGDYLYGAPAVGNKVDAQARLRPARDLFPEQWPGYEFGHVIDSFYETFQIDPITLDEKGRGRLKIENRWNAITSPAWVSATVSLYESGGRPVARSRSWQVWPAETLVGIRCLTEGDTAGTDGSRGRKKDSVTQVKSDSTAEFEVICVDKDGQSVAVSGLKAVVIREHRDYYWEFKNGAWQWGYTRQFYPVERFDVDIPGDGSAKVQVPVQWGGYRLELTHPVTGLVTSYRIWAGWRYTAGGEGGGNRPDRVNLTLDKPAYLPGETVKVLVKAPEGGKGYLFVEADTNLLTRTITIPPEGKSVEIKIDPSWQRHDLYISALIVRPGEARIEALPKRSVGLIHLPLDRRDRRLNLDIGVPNTGHVESPDTTMHGSPATFEHKGFQIKIEPDQTIDVPVRVTRPLPRKNGEGKKVDGSQKARGTDQNTMVSPSFNGVVEETWVTLAVVDVGVLNLTDFKTPAPWDYFFQPRRYGVEMHDLYQKLIEPGKGAWARQRFGGDAPRLSRGGDRPESDVRILSIHKAAVPVDGDGVAHFRITLPDFNGAVRFMAVAYGANRFGSAEQEVKVVSPLVVQMAMPRFLSMGDRSQLMVDLHNLSGRDQVLNVQLDAESPVRAVGETHHPLTLKAGEKKSIRLPVLAEQKIGRATIVCTIDGLMTAEGKTRKMVKQWFLETRPPYPASTMTWRRALKPGESFSTASQDLIADTVTVETTLSSMPAINITDHVNYLNAYPYGCLEQITSGIYPHVLMGSADFAALGIQSQSDRERMEKVTLGIERLLEKQKATGGFGLWRADSPEDFWLTAYVTDFLINAREAGYSVPVDALSKALDRLLLYVRRGGTVKSQYHDDTGHYPAAVRAYAAMVLARVQSLTLGDARSLYRTIQDDMKGLLGGVQAGIALYLAGDRALAIEAFDKAIKIERDDHHYYGDYGSRLRDTALASYLLITYCPDLPAQYGGDLLFRINALLENRRWLSTQERNALVMAGISIMKQSGSPWHADVHVGNRSHKTNGEPLVLTGKRMHHFTDSGADVADGVRITNTGTETLFIDVAMNGYPSQKPAPQSHGATIQRRYLSMGGEVLPESLFYWPGVASSAINPVKASVGEKSVPLAQKSDLAHRDDAAEVVASNQRAGAPQLKSGRRMIVELRFQSEQRLPHALVVDLLPACLELEDPSLAGSRLIDDVVVDGKSISKWHEGLAIQHKAYRDDRFVAAVHMEKKRAYRLFYPVRVVTPGEFLVPPPLIEDMYRPYIRGIGDAVPLMPVMNP